jgi:hypothetical protein
VDRPEGEDGGMTDKQRLLALHIEAVRVRDASFQAFGMALRITGNGLATPFKKTWEAACEAEEAIHRRITNPVIPFRSKKR